MTDHTCTFCGKPIPPAVIKARRYTLAQLTRPIYCNQAHLVADRVAKGFYKRISPLGNAAQMAIKRETGQRPGHEGRSAHMHRINAAKHGRQQ